MIEKIYKKCIEWASHKSSKKILSIVSFAESSFFPIPPDIMIIPMVIAKKNDYLKIFSLATIFSALGGVFGYFIGSVFLEVAMSVIEFYSYENKVLFLKNNLSTGKSLYIWLATLFLAGFTPLPFKVFTITSGIIGFNIFIFFSICIVSRGLRFFVVAYLSFKFGNAINQLMKKEISEWFLIISLIIVLIGTIVYLIIK